MEVITQLALFLQLVTTELAKAISLNLYFLTYGMAGWFSKKEFLPFTTHCLPDSVTLSASLPAGAEMNVQPKTINEWIFCFSCSYGMEPMD